MLKPYNKAAITFDLLTEIGADGRNSRTFVAHDHQLNAEIVTKQMMKSKLGAPERFFAESQALYASAHPNVVQIHYACEDADHVYLAMPHYRRGSVKSLITDRHMTVREIVTIACQVLSGLHNIHSKGLIHFDIKPDNILLSERGEGLVSDFGQAKEMNLAGIARQDELYARTLPPEAFATGDFDVTFDIYQFGLTLYRMCNGNPAFYAQLERYDVAGAPDLHKLADDVVSGRFPDRKAFSAHIPSRLRKIIRKCLELDSVERYQSALHVANALADVDGNELDWRLVETSDTRTWIKNEEGTLLEMTVKHDGGSECFKTKDGGARRRVTDGCRSSISERDLQKFLGSY